MSNAGERGNKGFTFIWRIKNFSFCSQEKEESLDSPKYLLHSLEKSEWFLRIYPRGRIFDSFIPCFLRRVESDDGPARLVIDYNICVIAVDGSHCFSKEIIGHSFQKFSGFGFPDFIKLQDINRNRSHYIPGDTLTLRCQMWRTDIDLNTSTFCSACTRIGVETRFFTWSIKNFTTRSWRQRLTVPIATASKQLPTFNISFGLTAIEETLNITIEKVSDKSGTKSVFLRCEISLLDSTGKPNESKKEEHLFSTSSHETPWELIPFIKKRRLTSNPELFLPNDVLSLSCGFSISSGVVSENVDEFIYGPSTCRNQCLGASSKTIQPADDCSLRNDIHRLYRSQNFCDLTLRTGSTYILVHKALICARSPVFSEMVQNNELGILDVPDIDPDVLNRMITFIYTDVLQHTPWEKAMELYSVAAKYQIQSLKKMCSSVIRDDLSSDNVCDMLVFANEHEDTDLRQMAQDFICRYPDEVFCSDKWKRFIVNWIQLAGEIMHDAWLKNS